MYVAKLGSIFESRKELAESLKPNARISDGPIVDLLRVSTDLNFFRLAMGLTSRAQVFKLLQRDTSKAKQKQVFVREMAVPSSSVLSRALDRDEDGGQDEKAELKRFIMGYADAQRTAEDQQFAQSAALRETRKLERQFPSAQSH